MAANYDATEVAIKTERLLRKYKFIIILIIILIIAAFSYNKISENMRNSKEQETTRIYLAALKNQAAAEQIAELKAKNPNLYAAYLLNTGKALPDGLKTDALLADLAAIKTGDNKIFLADLKTLEKAYAAMQSGDKAAALSLAKSIPASSAFYAMAQALIHYGDLQ